MKNLPKFLILLLGFFIILNIVLVAVYVKKTSEKGGTFKLSPLSVFENEPKPGNCLVLEEKYCKRGERVNYRGEFFGLGFRLPEGTKIYAPFKGEFSKSRVLLDGKTYEGIGVYYTPAGKVDPDAIGFFAVVYPRSPTPKITIEKGELIAEVGGQKIEVLGEYNLVLNFQRYNLDTKLMDIDLELFRRFFDL